MEVLYRLKENKRLLLDDPEKVWVAMVDNCLALLIRGMNQLFA
jgi:hypothetical protein